MVRKWCKHYRGMHRKDQCEAGVAFVDLPNAGTKLFQDSCPCFGDKNAANCEKAEYPTEQEMADKEKEIVERFAKIGKARESIVAYCGGPWKRGMGGSSDLIDCPVCNGAETLQFSRAGYNGHIHARCATKGCVAWME